MLKRILGYTIALVALFAVASGLTYAATISPFTGPTGTNPAAVPNNLPDLNALVQSLQTNTVGGTGTLSSVLSVPGTGQTSSGTLQMLNSGSFAGVTTNTTTGVSLTTGSLGPTGLVNKTATGFLTFTDSNGRISFIPFWQ